MYCLSALEHFADLPDEEVQKIVFEVGMLGAKGFEINDPEQQYELRSMPGKFSGMQMVCIMYVGFKRIAPEHAASFDLTNEYALGTENVRGEAWAVTDEESGMGRIGEKLQGQVVRVGKADTDSRWGS